LLLLRAVANSRGMVANSRGITSLLCLAVAKSRMKPGGKLPENAAALLQFYSMTVAYTSLKLEAG
jgi:hypothetical protein